jgi:hypothetical protein
MADYAILFGGVAALVVLNIYIALLFLMRVLWNCLSPHL